MMVSFIENIGSRVIAYSIGSYAFLVFFFKVLAKIFLPSSYSKSSIDFFFNQIYLSGIKHIFSFLFSALFLGSILIVIAISFALNFNLQEQIGDILVIFVINEFSPFFTTLFFIFTYTLVSKERIDNLKQNNIDMISEIYIPKLLTTVFMIPLMSLLFATIMITSGYAVSSLYLNIDLLTYKNLIINSISFENIFVLLLKGVLFGFISIFIPIFYAHKNDKVTIDVTQTIIKILIIILSMLLLIELLSILIFY